MAGRKRVYAMPMSSSSRPFKKRRVFKRKYRRGYGKKMSQFTSTNGSGRGVGFAKRRFKPRLFRRQLYNSSMTAKHYRACHSSTTGLTTPGTTTTMSTSLQTSRRFSGAAFWTTSGGAINPDGGAMPTFVTDGDITVRGGVYGLRLCNLPNTNDVDKEPLQVIVYLIRTSKGFSLTNFPATVTNGWDPSLVQDFQTNIGKIVLRRNFLLKDGEVFCLERRMSVQKVDPTEYAGTISEMVWAVLIGNAATTTTGSVAITTYYNMSFVGDVV